jgi:plastocyanin
MSGMTRKLIALALALTPVAALAAPAHDHMAAPAPAAPQGQVVTIVIKNFDFTPMNVTVPVGGQVVWKNLDGEIHTVVSLDGAFRSVALDQGDTFTFRFTKPGTYAYLCSVHPQMKATVVVR